MRAGTGTERQRLLECALAAGRRARTERLRLRGRQRRGRLRRLRHTAGGLQRIAGERHRLDTLQCCCRRNRFLLQPVRGLILGDQHAVVHLLDNEYNHLARSQPGAGCPGAGLERFLRLQPGRRRQTSYSRLAGDHCRQRRHEQLRALLRHNRKRLLQARLADGNGRSRRRGARPAGSFPLCRQRLQLQLLSRLRQPRRLLQRQSERQRNGGHHRRRRHLRQLTLDGRHSGTGQPKHRQLAGTGGLHLLSAGGSPDAPDGGLPRCDRGRQSCGLLRHLGQLRGRLLGHQLQRL